MEETLRETIQYQWFKSRGITDFAGWLQFFKEWHHIAEILYKDWPYKKKKILNPHENWARAYEQMQAFMQIEGNQSTLEDLSASYRKHNDKAG